MNFLSNLIAIVIFCAGPVLLAQEDSKPSPVQISTKLILPLVFFTPETSWGFGAAGLLGFRYTADDSSSRPSTVQLGGAYTLERQLLLYTSYQTFWQQNVWQSFGEIGYYRYTYFFYGIGNESAFRGEELYNVNFPRIRLHLLRKIDDQLYIGGQVWFDDQQISEVESGGLLDDAGINIEGRMGGKTIAPGFIIALDTRNQVNYPSQGYFISLDSRLASKAYGSDFNYWRSTLNANLYFPFAWQHHLAVNLYLENIEGNAPFFAMASLGGTRRMRGYYEGFYRDLKYATFQMSYRMPLFWRLKLHVFSASGSVAPRWSKWTFKYLRNTYGMGLRFLINERDLVHIRLDAAFGNDTSGFYLTVGEAF